MGQAGPGSGLRILSPVSFSLPFPASYRPQCSCQNNGLTITLGFSAVGGVTLLPPLLLPHCCVAFALEGPLVLALPALRVPIVWGNKRQQKKQRGEVIFPGSHSPSLANQGQVS